MSTTFEYRFYNSDFDLHHDKLIEMYIKNGMKSSSWFKNLPTYTDSPAKNYWNHWKHTLSRLFNNELSKEDVDKEFFADNPGNPTVKRCPGIKDLLSKSLVITSPCEMFIEVKDGEIFSTHVSAKHLATIHFHNERQFKYNGDNTFENLVNAKINIPILYRINSDIVMLPATYHNPSTDFIVAPGAISKKYSNLQELNVNTFINVKENKTIYIKEGEPLAYLWTNSGFKIKHNPDLFDLRMKTKFNDNLRNLI